MPDSQTSTLNLPLQIVYNQPCFTIQTDQVALAVTRIGGQMAPVEFFRKSENPIMPYHIAPWWAEGCKPDQPPLLHILRGDFFCCPFGANETPCDGIQYPIHGEAANLPWELTDWQTDAKKTILHLTQPQTLRKGQISKKLTLAPGENVVYSCHTLSDMEGPMDLGHHANLRFPDIPRCGHLSFSPFVHAQVYMQPTELPENKGYSMLSPGAIIDDLTKVSTITGQTTDLTRYPDRRGFEDIIILCADRQLDFAWTTVAFPEQGYVWFALKDPKILASTLLWMSNGGRHYEPWNGRHINVMGLEEITAYFHDGIAASAAENHLNKLGIPTTLQLSQNTPTDVNYIQGVARIPADFDRVAEISRESANSIKIVSHRKQVVQVRCRVDFLGSGEV
ncbi:MAG: hypothetical protein ACT6FF_02530 [Methanosarcinaceae archaeon]